MGPAFWPLPRRGKLPCAHMELRGQGWVRVKTTLDSLGSYPTARTSEILDVDACNVADPPTRHDGHACENAPSDHTYTRYVNTNFTPRRKAMSLPPMTASGTPSAVPPKFIARGVVPIPPGEAIADLAPWLLGRRCWFHRGVAFQKGMRLFGKSSTPDLRISVQSLSWHTPFVSKTAEHAAMIFTSRFAERN